MKISDHIHIVASGESGFSLTNPFDCTVYLIDGKDECALIDAGVGVEPERILNEIKKSGIKPESINKILLTHGHGDHAGGAKILSELLGAKVYAMDPAATFIRDGDIEHLSLTSAIEAGVYEKGYRFRPCDTLPLIEGEKIQVGLLTLKVVSSEGHSAGHCCYVMQEGDATVLFAGDSVQCGGKIALQAIWDCDLQKYISTIRKLNELRPDMLLPAHGAFAVSRGYIHLQKACSILDTLALPKNTIGE